VSGKKKKKRSEWNVGRKEGSCISATRTTLQRAMCDGRDKEGKRASGNWKYQTEEEGEGTISIVRPNQTTAAREGKEKKKKHLLRSLRKGKEKRGT